MAILERRLPFYLLLDCSESMVGEPLDAVDQGLRLLCVDLRDDPMAIETAWISVITFARQARQLCPLTEVLQFAPPTLTVGPGTSLGAALDLLTTCLAREVRTATPNQKGDWKPTVFLLTDGQPTDDWQQALRRFQAATARSVVNFIAIGCGPDADAALLRTVTPNVLMMKDLTAGSLRAFFKWVSTSVRQASVGIGVEGRGVELPTLPPGMETAGTAAHAPAATTPSQYLLLARCRDSGKGYLMRYRRAATGDVYEAEPKGHPVDADYLAEAQGGPAGQTIDSSKLHGAPACPYCHRPAWAPARDGTGLVCSDTMSTGTGRAQVLFVLDVTGSMMHEIDGVKDNIKDFLDYIQTEGLEVEVGLIAFRDLQEREPPEVLSFGEGSVFTSDAKAFKKRMAKLTALGGGSNPGESSLDALVLASRQPFRSDGARIVILITDEPPLLPDGEINSFDDVTQALTAARVDQLHLVLPDPLRRVYAPLHSRLKGEVFPLGTGKRGGKAFRKVLLDIGKSITVATRIG
jgi:uncharacterized protein YegL